MPDDGETSVETSINIDDIKVKKSKDHNLIIKLDEKYFMKLKYPDTYKVSSMYISKFEKNADRGITYQFINAFPKSITPIPVTYGSADLLKVSVSFNYDRYIVNRKVRQPSILSTLFNLFTG